MRARINQTTSHGALSAVQHTGQDHGTFDGLPAPTGIGRLARYKGYQTMHHTIPALCLLLFFFAPLQAARLTLKSTPEQTLLLELYTSEGCSSCPAADRWLAKLIDHKELWKKIIPVAFHVDYWDRLGWQDKFASAQFSKRQRRYRLSGAASAVYTPGFFVNGKEWKTWFRHPVLDYKPATRPGVLHAEVGTREIRVHFQPTHTPTQPLVAHLALLGTNIKNAIKNGENAGKILTHTFVVLKHSVQRQQPGTTGLHWTFPYPKKNYHGHRPSAIAVWISSGTHLAPIQSVGGWLPQRR